jgi:hypothetical protein
MESRKDMNGFIGIRGGKGPYVLKGAFVCFVTLVILSVHLLLATRGRQESRTRAELLNAIRQFGQDVTVSVDGRESSVPDKIVDAILQLSDHRAHHSHPEDTFLVTIQKATDVVTLRLGRDSEIGNEYWVSVLRKESGSFVHVGSIRTDVFAENPGIRHVTPTRRVTRPGAAPAPVGAE